MNRFYKSFQGLKAYAILLVFFSHCVVCTNSYGANVTSKWGACGVELFIMMSGYLTAINYNNSEKTSSMIIRKIKRFYWLHIGTLFFAIPFSIKLLLGFDLKTWGALLSNVFLIQAWIPDENIYFSYNSVAWYLSCYVFFVVSSPVCYRLWKKMNKYTTLFCILTLLGAEVVICYFSQNMINAHWIIYIFPITRLLDFFAGGTIAELTKYIMNRQVLTVVGMVLLIPLLVLSMYVAKTNWWFSAVMWYIPACFILLGIEETSWFNKTFFQNSIIQYIGKRSFEVFLVHQLCIRYIDYFFENTSAIVLIPIKIVISFGMVELLCYVKRKYMKNNCKNVS